MRTLTLIGLFLLLTACGDNRHSPTIPGALSVGTPFTVFSATSREPETDGTFGYRRSEDLHLLELTVSIPPTHKPGSLKFGYENADPKTRFVMASRSEFAGLSGFSSKISKALKALPPAEREITVFVHGYNSTQAESAFRMAQFAHDTKVRGPVVLYSWPSRGRPLGYAYDADSMLFARDGLERVLREMNRISGGRVVLMAHSMGSSLSMETLRQIDISTPGWSARNLQGVLLISPDIDISVFRTQMTRMTKVPQPFIIFASEKDPVLQLSSRLTGAAERQRLGNIRNPAEVADLPVTIIDTTAFNKDAERSHFIPASSPALIAVINETRSVGSTLRDETRSMTNLLPGSFQTTTRATEIKLVPQQSDNK